MIRRAVIAVGTVLIIVISVILAKQLMHPLEEWTDVDGAAEENVKLRTPQASTAEVTVPGYHEDGWNLDESGWWYKLSDGTMYVDGWKLLDGKEYYFQKNGYMANGWTATQDGDMHFLADGTPDPTAYQKLCALTYDDGPSPTTTEILDILEENSAKATFFVVGQTQAAYYSDILKREYDLGMEIGNHSYEHIVLSASSAEEITTSLKNNDNLISEITGGFVPKLIRPTGGGISETLTATADRPLILWDVDTLDWENKNADLITQEALSKVQDGSIILMHDLDASTGEATVEATRRIVPKLREMGYRMVTVSEMAKLYGYTLMPAQQVRSMYPQDSPNLSAVQRYRSGKTE